MGLLPILNRQTLTYLLLHAPSSISFLVFLNSSLPFLLSDRLAIDPRQSGDISGSLAFADELVALFACVAAGALADWGGGRGARAVAVGGFLILGVALAGITFVREGNGAFTGLLIDRIVFAVGGAGVTTMVTALLPALTSPSISSDTKATQSETSGSTQASTSTPPFLAGLAGTATGLGALISLSVFLPLPAFLQRKGYSASQAIVGAYWIVAALAWCVAVGCWFGFKDLSSPKRKAEGFSDDHGERHEDDVEELGHAHARSGKVRTVTRWLKEGTSRLGEAAKLGFSDSEIGLSYIGGAVARASSIGITLFIPLYVNAYFAQEGKCPSKPSGGNGGGGLGDLKGACREGYLVAAKLTGLSQFAALVTAPLFGYFASRLTPTPLLVFGAAIGILSYILLPESEPTGKSAVFLSILAGISQICAIVCSLGGIGRGVLRDQNESQEGSNLEEGGESDPLLSSRLGNGEDEENETDEGTGIAHTASSKGFSKSRSHLKGSVAGLYSLSGGVGILLLTKLGGYLFDQWAIKGPFLILAGFNMVLAAAGLIRMAFSIVGLKRKVTKRILNSESNGP